jgi:hypothetical protein
LHIIPFFETTRSGGTLYTMKTITHIHKSIFKNYFYGIIVIIFSLLLHKHSMAGESSYNISVEKNLFSPARKKWVIPEKTEQKRVVKKILDKNKMPILRGVVISDQEKLAVVQFHTISKKAGRMSGQGLFAIGDSLGDF